jgi:hypothetical protein
VGKVSSSTAAAPPKTSSTSTSAQPVTTSSIKTTSSVPVTTQPATTTRPVTSSTLVTTTTAAANQPQNSGTASNCNNFYKVASGDSCDVITSKFGISFTQFRTWNTAVNSGMILRLLFTNLVILTDIFQAAPTFSSTTTIALVYQAPPPLHRQPRPLRLLPRPAMESPPQPLTRRAWSATAIASQRSCPETPATP